MILDLPKLGAVRFDDDLTPEQLNSQLDALAKKYEFELPKPEMGYGEMAGKAFTRGTKRLGETFGDIIPAMGAKALGYDEYAKRQMEEAAATEAEISKYYAPQYGALSDVKGISDVPGFVLENLAEQTPNILTSLVPGVGAEAIAARMGAGAVGKAVAGNAGIFLGSYAQNAPDTFQGIYEKTGKMAVPAALIFGAGQAALDSVLPSQLLKNLTGPVKIGIVEKILEKSGMQPGLVRSITANALKDAGYEGLTEGAQEAISIYAENFVANHPQVFNSGDWHRIMEASVRGSLAGGPFGVAGGVSERVQEKRQEFEEQQQKQAEEQRAALAEQAKQAGLSVEELQAAQAQGTLPGFETGPATQLLVPDAQQEAAKELQGKQLSLIDATGAPTKVAEGAKAKGDKAEAIRARQAQQRQAAELKATQAKLKSLFKATQLPLDLKEAPPSGGAAVEGQPDLFGAPAAPAVAEPTVVKKPVKLTPQQLDTKINDDTLKTLGVGPTAILRKEKVLEGKDISNPVDAAEVKRILEEYADRPNLSTNIREKVEAYLNRPEFKQEAPSGEPISEPTGPVGGELQPSVRGINEAIPTAGPTAGATETVESGVGPAGPAIEPVNAGEELPQRPLGKKEQADVTKAQAAIEPAIEDKIQFIKDNDDRVVSMMENSLPKGANTAGLEDTDAFKLFRIAPLIQEYNRLKEVIAKGAEPKQLAKNQQELAIVHNALLNSGLPQSEQAVRALDAMNADQVQNFIGNINKAAKDELAKEAKERASKLTPEELAKQEEDAKLAEQAKKLDEAWVTARIKKAIESGKVDNLIDAAIEQETDPDVKKILEKIKKMGLTTNVKTGKIEQKPGRMNMRDVGEFDPATNSITYDPDFLNRNTTVHEIVHAAVSKVLLNPNHPLTKELTGIYNGIYNQLGSSYGALDIHEFAAELIGNKEFQATLKTIKAPRGGNMFQRAMQAIAEFFGFRKGTSAYEAGLNTISKIIDVSGNVEAPDSAKMYHGIGHAVNEAFEAVGDIGRKMPLLTERTTNQVLNNLSNIKDYGAMKAAMGLMRLDNLNTIYGNKLSIQPLLDSLEQRAGVQHQQVVKINENYKRFAKAVEQHPEAAKRMNDMAVDARIAQVDPADPNFKAPTGKDAEYRRLRSVFNALPKDLQDTYTGIRKEYEDALDSYQKFLLSKVSPSLRDKLKLKFETDKRLTAYIPFLRRGDFWIEYADPNTGERTVQAFESIRERDAFVAKDLPKDTQVKQYRNLQDIRYDPRVVPPTSFIAQVMEDLRKTGASNETIDNVYQAYLALMPAESISKRFMKSDDVLGMERDIVRGYGDTMIKWARKLADSQFAPDIDNSLSRIREEGRASPDMQVAAAAETIVDQGKFYHNPTYGSAVTKATALSYFEYIAGNLSSAVVNLSTLPMFTWPVLGAKFGFNKASSAMLAASKVMINGMEKDPRYKRLYQMLQDHNQLQHTLAREVLDARRVTTGQYTGIRARIMDALTYPFSATERHNRGVTAIAAYDLAKGMGMGEEAALRYALNTTKDINTSGMAVTAPKYMQSPLGRVFFTFKSFAWNSAFVTARAFHQAFKGVDPETRRIARRQLLGMYGMAGAFAGVKGLPFYGLAETIGQMINALFGDDDEPYDFNEDMRQFFGELAYKGPTNYFTNLEISNRTGVAQDLIWRDDPRSIAENGYVFSAMKNAFGPAGSYAVNFENAIKMMNEGHTERALEAVLPSFVRNGMKGMRYMGEGALTLKGDPVDEDIGAYNSLMQIVGFSPASLSSTYETTSVAKAYEKETATRRQRLLNKYDMARHAGDSDLMGEVRDDISEFNAKHPKDRIDGSTLSKSQKARAAAERNMINGVTFNKKLKGEIQEKFFKD